MSYDSNQPNKPFRMPTPIATIKYFKLGTAHSRVFDILDRARYEMAERNQPIYGNPAFKEAQRMMGYEWDPMRSNCVELYEKNLGQCIQVMDEQGLSTTAENLRIALNYLQK